MPDPAALSDINWLSPDLTAPFDFSIFDPGLFQDQVSAETLPTSPSQTAETTSIEFMLGSEATNDDPLILPTAKYLNNRRIKALYVDSDGSRLTCNERVRPIPLNTRSRFGTHRSSRNFSSERSFPPLNALVVSNGGQFSIGGPCYETLQDAFVRYCLDSAPIFQPFETQHFPSAGYFSIFVNLYFEYFHGTWPILHAPTFDTASADCLLILSIATIGCRYYPDADCVGPMQEFLRRSVLIEVW